MSNIRCGHCGRTHPSPQVVRACSQGSLSVCDAPTQRFIEGHPEDKPHAVIDTCTGTVVTSADGLLCTNADAHVVVVEVDSAAVRTPAPIGSGDAMWRSMNPSREYREERARSANTAWGSIRELHRAYND